jgi:hypothetical protein
MSKNWKIITVSVMLLLGFLFISVYFSLRCMAIEDTYGDLQQAYYDAHDGDVVIVDDKEVGFFKKYDYDAFIAIDGCMKHLSGFHSNKIEIYDVRVNQTYIHLSIDEAVKLKNSPDSKLIYKNF